MLKDLVEVPTQLHRLRALPALSRDQAYRRIAAILPPVLRLTIFETGCAMRMNSAEEARIPV
jgi:hypothetical protein